MAKSHKVNRRKIAKKKAKKKTKKSIQPQGHGVRKVRFVMDENLTQRKEIIKEKKEKIVCPRCNGDRIWHSSATGVRAKTSSEPLVDSNRQCPKCHGEGAIFV